MRVFKSRWFQRFCRKEGLEDPALLDAVDRASRGQIDADLGGGVIKQRIARPGEGKSGGYRAIILFRQGERSIFVYGFPKSRRDTIRPDELSAFREAAKHVLSLTERQIADLVAQGDFVEVPPYDHEVSQ